MTNQSTLISSQISQQPKEKVRNAAVFDPVFGGFELESLFELATRGQGELVNKPEESRQILEHKVGSAFIDGTIAGFENPRGIEDVYPGGRRIDEETAQQLTVWRKNLASEGVEKRRTEINKLNGFDPSYLGTMDEEGNPDTYHLNQADKKQSENIAFDIQQQRAELVKASGRKTSSKAVVSGGVDLERDFENRNLSGRVG